MKGTKTEERHILSGIVRASWLGEGDMAGMVRNCMRRFTWEAGKGAYGKKGREKTEICLNYWQSCGEEDDWNNAGIQRINGSIVFG